MSILPDRPATPLGSARRTGPSIVDRDGPPAADTVWLLEDARGTAEESSLAIAERLGVGFRRVPLAWRLTGLAAALSRGGTLRGLSGRLPLQSGLPSLTLSAGRRAAVVAAWLKRETGSRMVHYGPAGLVSGAIDLHVVDGDGQGTTARLPLLGAPHRVSPFALSTARGQWRERLDHLPHPRLALLVGGGPFGAELRPADAHRIGTSLAHAVKGAGGAILAVAGAGTGREATEALAAGLRDCLHLIYRTGEPGPDAATGFLASADVIVVAGDAPAALVRACATAAPVYTLGAGPVRPRLQRLHLRLEQAGQIRRLQGRIEAWDRPRLDEAGRAADAIHAACLLAGHG